MGSKKEDWPECKTSVSMGMTVATVVWPELIGDETTGCGCLMTNTGHRK